MVSKSHAVSAMGSNCGCIPHELRNLNRWVCASEGSKRPLCSFSKHPANVTDRSTWGSFEEAREAVESGKRDWLGFVFADDGYVGIDIDDGFDEYGFPKTDALEFIRSCNSYTEISKSGKGFHIICKGDLPFKGKANGEGWEIYKDGRFFVLTGHVLEAYEVVRDGTSAIKALLNQKFQNTVSNQEKSSSNVIWKPVWGEPIDADSGRIRLDPDYPEISSGSRHLSLVSFCGTWFSAGCSDEFVFKLAERANEKYLKPPLPDEEVSQVVRSCAKYRRG